MRLVNFQVFLLDYMYPKTRVGIERENQHDVKLQNKKLKLNVLPVFPLFSLKPINIMT